MSKPGIGRTIVAVIASYLTNAILVVASERLLLSLEPGGAAPPLYYFVLDLISQCLYTMLAGYLCCVIARTSQWIAMAGLIGLGLSVGTVSLVMSWKFEPHWYGMALLAVYAPCVWIGWLLRSRVNAQSFSDL
jgi:hypothetical protein